jgi:pre-60S factor REI1
MLGALTTATTVAAMVDMEQLSHQGFTAESPAQRSTSASSSSETSMQPFTPGQCLFCSTSSPSFNDSVSHMQRSHGLFVPRRDHLLVDLEILVEYLHLVIFGYRECIRCGTTRHTVEAVKMHMKAKGHCSIDVEDPESEFAEFYDFNDQEEIDEGKTADGSDAEEFEEDHNVGMNKAKAKARLTADGESIRLPSGKLVSRKLAESPRPSLRSQRRPRQPEAPQIELPTRESHAADRFSGEEAAQSSSRSAQALTRREKRNKAIEIWQVAKMRADDRSSLMHLSSAQQRSLLATQQNQQVKGQKAQARQQRKLDRKGNKNLYAYWHTETPVYQCG